MSTFGFFEYVQTSAFSNLKLFRVFRWSMFSMTPVERLSRQIILEPNPTRVSQIQLPKNPDPPDTRTHFPWNALGSIDLLIAARSSLIIGSFNLDARPPKFLLGCGLSRVFIRQILGFPVKIWRTNVQPCFLRINRSRVNVEVPVYNLLDAVGELELASEPSLRRLQCLEYYWVEHVDGHDR